jgi:hypothetical protein
VCEISLVLREEYKLSMCVCRVLRNIFVSKKEEVTGDWRKLHNKELYTFYSLPNIMRMIKLGRMGWNRKR